MRAAFLLALLLASGMASAQIYSWRDAGGTMHFSDTPPPGVDAKKINPAAPSGDDGAAARKALADQEMQFRKRRSEAAEAQAKADKEQKAGAEREINCKEAKNALQGLESGQIRYKAGGDGAPIPLDDQTRVAETARARDAVQAWCK